jgi:outer membrane lipoprotein SlyB
VYVESRPYTTYSRPSRAASGALLGGIAGAIIGHNSGDLRHNAWRGAAIGAGAGLLLGSLADRAEETRPAVVNYASPENEPVVNNQTSANSAATPQNVTIINNYYGSNTTPMGGANSLFGR